MYDASSAFCDAADLALSRPEVDQVASTFVQEWCRHVVAVPGAADLVRALSEQLRVGIVSNTHDAAMVAGLLMDLGLSDVVHAVVLSVDHGYRKPHPSIYQVALDALSVTAPEPVFVGDSLRADYLAPRSEERRVGKECVSTCRSRWSPDH